MKSKDDWENAWLSFGFAFVGGYADAASFLLTDTFTGHITGAFVMAAISVAAQDWLTCYWRFTGIAFFLVGILFSITLLSSVARRPSWPSLSLAMSIEILLISAAYLAITSRLATGTGLFVSCMSLAMGIQNGSWRKAGNIGIHTTFLTGLVTDLLAIETERHDSSRESRRDSPSDPAVGLLCGIWLAFVLGAGIGGAMVFRFKALAILGAVLPLLAMLIRAYSSGR